MRRVTQNQPVRGASFAAVGAGIQVWREHSRVVAAIYALATVLLTVVIAASRLVEWHARHGRDR